MIHKAVIRAAAAFVPGPQRAEWLAEWLGELWHVRRKCRGAKVTAFCMGAFRDAFWLWRAEPDSGCEWFFAESPARCLLTLTALGALCGALSLLLPGARAVVTCALYPRDLVMLTAGVNSDAYMPNGFIHPYPSVSWEQFEALKAHDGAEFSGLAFYVPKRNVARTTADLLQLLSIPVKSEISGWNLPGSVNAVVIEKETAFTHTRGYVVGRLRYDSLLNRRFSFVRLEDRSLEMLVMVPPIFLFAWILVGLMRICNPGSRPGWPGLRRVLFLAGKGILVLPVLTFGSLDVVCAFGPVTPLFFDIAFLGSIAAVRWILADQRKRCPVCLRLLANPVRVGESSRILLEWHGTELMCLRGHGLLYVPEWPALWSGRQRWLGLGASWGGLFH